jgi:hypothetical protein
LSGRPVLTDFARWLTGPRRCCVLDLETRPDRHACLLARRTKGAPQGSPVNEVVNASVLRFTLSPGWSFGGFDMVTFHEEEYAEPDILLNVAAELQTVCAAGGLLATFNGQLFDLPTLRMRQLRWWQWDTEAVSAFLGGSADHLDLMHMWSMDGALRWPTLADACASVGFSLMGPYRPASASHAPREAEKCETDVVGTMILLLYALAAREGSSEPLRRGLPALGGYLRKVAGGRPHLERFALSPLLEDDAAAWGAAASSVG